MDHSLLQNDAVVTIQNGFFNWLPTYNVAEKERLMEECILKNITVSLRNELVFVIGPVGAGKSSFANVCLGEMNKMSGDYAVKRTTVGYTSQNAWIINGTVKENVIFGRNVNQEWYNQVLKATTLDTDIALFELKDATPIGERGVNLSGGQKARLSLARALYAQPDFYILDGMISSF